MKLSLHPLLQNKTKWHLWSLSVVFATCLTLPIVAGMQLLLEGKVSNNYLITGFVASILVAFTVSGLIIYFLQILSSLKQDNDHLSGIIRQCPIPMALSDDKNNILELNPEFIKTFGYNLEDIPTLHEWWLQAYPDDEYRQSIANNWNSYLQNTTPFEPFETRICCKGGITKIFMAEVTQLYIGDNTLKLAVFYDITELKIYQERLNFALVGANDGLWDWNTETNEVYFSPRWKSMLGYLDNELANSLETWSQLVDPSVRSQILAYAYAYLNGEQENYETEFRMRHKDGHWVDILARAKLATDANGQALYPRRLVGTHVDISHLKQIEKTLREKEGYQRALLDNFPFMVWLKDTQSRFLAVNQALANSLGESKPDNVIGKTDFDYSPHNLAKHYQQDDLAVLKSGQRKSVQEEHIDYAGTHRWIETFKAPVIDLNGDVLGTVGFASDISDRKKIEDELRIAATAFESQEGMIVTDANSIILKINQSFTRITGFTSEEAVGHKMKLLKSGIHDATFYKTMWDSILNTGSWQGEIWNKRKNGDIYPEWLTISAVKDKTGLTTHYVGTMIDITARKAIEERVHHLTHYDVLTDLPNRALLTDRLHQLLAQIRRDKTKLALMFLDLDNFKPVNDSLGHEVGDLLLKAVASRLENCVKRESDTVARVGGDEFIIILSHIEDENDASIVAEKIVDAITQPFIIDKNMIHISCSIGIGISPIHGSDVNSLIQVADNAMYDAKRAGRGCFRFYDTTATLTSNRTKSLPSNSTQ